MISFNLGDLHPHDLATALDYEGLPFVQVTTVHNPCLQYLQVPANNESKFYIYNTKADCDKLVEALIKAKGSFSMALSKLDSLYMAVVADHSKHPTTKDRLKMLIRSNSTIQLCGDVIQLSVKFDEK